MSEREEENQMSDPPENAGGNKAQLDGTEEAGKASDPPSNDGGS